MKKLLQKIWKNRSAALILSLVLIIVLVPDTAFGASELSEELDTVVLKMNKAINVMFSVVHAVFWPILLLIGSLMDNDLIFGPGIGERLREIWVVIRNIVNIVFVFLLLIVAFYNVASGLWGGGGEGSFALKTVMPKFIVAVIVVNFSFLGCKVILDTANVLSMAVYDLATVVEDYDPDKQRAQLEATICGNPTSVVEENADAGMAQGGDSPESAPEADGIEAWDYNKATVFSQMFCCHNGNPETGDYDSDCAVNYVGTEDEPTEIYPSFNSFANDFFKKLDQNNIGVVMAINLGGLNELTSISGNKGKIDMKGLTVNTIFSIIMYLVFGIAYIALFIVLLARLVVLWFVIALSPIIVLAWVVPQINQYTSELNLGERFIKHLMAPIIIGLSMSIGYLMASKLSQTSGAGIETSFGTITGGELLKGDSTGALLTPNIADIQQLLIAAIAVAVVWLGVFGAADQTIASSVTGKIKEYGTRAAKFAATLPTYLPFIPMTTKDGKTDDYSLKAVTGAIQIMAQRPGIEAAKSARKLSDDILGPSDAEMSERFKTLYKEFKDTDDTTVKSKKIREMLRGEIRNKEDYRVFNEMLKESKVDIPKDLEWSKFGDWYNANGREKIDAARLDTQGEKYTDNSASAEKPAADTTTPEQETKQIITDITINATDKPTAVTRLSDGIANSKFSDPSKKQEVLELLVNDENKLDQSKVDKLEIDENGVIQVKESISKLKEK